MADKVHTLQLLLERLSRIPGLGFLSSVGNTIQSVDDQIEDAEHQLDYVQRNARDVQQHTGNLLKQDDE
ncbi:MAG: hypothetical protein MUF06_06235 [Pirellulaceae bacterium]|jgi:hypothetical protein|nr:hypothetical protein [Pirellulaceae bacterium]